MVQLPFSNRFEAGRLLGSRLLTNKWPEDTIVLALPRGGVPVGSAVASILGAPLDVVVVRKLGVPRQPELAMGAIAGAGVRILDEDLIRHLGISDATVDSIVAKEAAELERRERLYRKGRSAPDLHDRTVILVDDGLATGSTMSAAVHYVNKFQPAAVIVAVPIGSAQACQQFRSLVADCVCLATPEPLYSVGAWYADFQQMTDSEVQQWLDQHNRQNKPLLKTEMGKPELERKR